MGFGGCGWTSSANFSIMVRPSLTFMESAPNYASAADDATNFKMVQRVKIALLSVMGSPSFAAKPRNKWPFARLLAFFAEI